MMRSPRARYLAFFTPTVLAASPAKTAKDNHPSGGIPSLDGLRGVACLFVVSEHVLYNFSKTFLFGYAVIDNFYVIQWPFVRILWCGLSMVNIFFIISGYVLAYKPLLQIHRGDSSGARATIASSTVRRIPRLYLPMWVMVLICALMTWLGFFNRSIQVWNTEDNIYNLHESLPLRFNNFWHQMGDAIKHAWRTLDIFTMKDHLVHAEHYDLHTWTIPVEFRCSMILFAVISAISQFKMRYRISITALVATVVMTMHQPNTMMFLTGAILSDIDHRVRTTVHQSANVLNHSVVPSAWERYIAVWLHPDSRMYPILFVIGIYLLCVPTFFYALDPFYSGLIRAVPLQGYVEPDIWLRYYGAIMVVWAVANSTKLKPLFVNPVSTYLGKISYALYLVHGNIIRSLLYAAIPTIYSLTGDGTRENQTPTQMFFSAAFGLLLVFPLSIYLADLFTKAVDVPLTRLGKKLELAMMEDHHRTAELPLSSRKLSV